jgi:thymidylate kinase
LTRLVYYLAATSHMVDLVDPTRPVIFDRWLPSVLGLIETSGDLDRDDIAAIAEPIASRLPAPRATIVLTAAPDVLQRRVTGRRKPPLHHTEAHHMAFADPQWLSSWQHAILFWSARLGPHHVIDTSTMALDEVTVTIQEMWTPDGESHR